MDFNRSMNVTNTGRTPKGTSQPQQGEGGAPGSIYTSTLVERPNLSIPRGQIGESEKEAASVMEGNMLPTIGKGARKTGTL